MIRPAFQYSLKEYCWKTLLVLINALFQIAHPDFPPLTNLPYLYKHFPVASVSYNALLINIVYKKLV